ncbi:hypothetical protein ACQPW1_30120 [Nocardia sp. CA-128927]|uniref:hypothetical protein n=1 Tax=Nocardia sp. CA-128927 TaxID=3239975 RepID=UPI003D964D50
MLDPGFGPPELRDDLSNLIVMVAQTGDEWTSTCDLVTTHILPLLCERAIRFVEVARAGTAAADGIVVLQDSRSPVRLHPDADEHGFYALSAEHRANGVLPTLGGKRTCSVDCTSSLLTTKELVVAADSDLRSSVMHGLIELPRIGKVVAGPGNLPPFLLVDAQTAPVEPALQYLRDLALGDASPSTCKSYSYDLLRWFRLLWLLEVAWDHATEAEVALLVGWMRTAPNPQRQRRRAGAPAPGTVNVRTGKQSLKAGFAPRTINHCLSVIYGLYAYHGSFGRGPVINPVPESAERREKLAHLSPLEPKPVVRRARLRKCPQSYMPCARGNPQLIPAMKLADSSEPGTFRCRAPRLV